MELLTDTVGDKEAQNETTMLNVLYYNYVYILHYKWLPVLYKYKAWTNLNYIQNEFCTYNLNN